MIEQIDLWQSVLLFFLAILLGYFLRALNFGEKFQMRQELRREHKLEQKRVQVAQIAAQ